jgi:hypothetical protein
MYKRNRICVTSPNSNIPSPYIQTPPKIPYPFHPNTRYPSTPFFNLIINNLTLPKPTRTRTRPPIVVHMPPPPRHPSFLFQRLHIPYPYLRQITHLLGAHGLHVVVVAAEAEGAVDGEAAGDEEAGTEKHEDDDYAGREEEAVVVLALDEVQGVGWHCGLYGAGLCECTVYSM